MTTARVCATPGCSTLTTTSYCTDHTPKPWAGSTRRTTLPTDWRRRRLRALRRDHWQCRTCGQPATDVDHVTPGGGDDLMNLQALCRRCHQAKTLGEARIAREQQQGRGPRG